MTPFPWSDLAIILALVLLNGVFAMSELAIVSASRNRLSSLADRGSKGAKAAVRLSNDPGKFLSTVQIGITLIGIINGAYSGASLGGPVAERIILLGIDPELAQTLGFGAVIGITTYLSLVIGELVPKQIALVAPEKFAAIIALPMEWLARLTAPIVWLLDNSSALIFRMIGLRRDSRKALSAEELQMIFAEAHQSGVIEEHERAVISGVVRLADRPVREVMTPRTDIDWLPANATAADVRSKLLESSHTRLPVAEESIDNILGVVQARDIVSAQFRG